MKPDVPTPNKYRGRRETDPATSPNVAFATKGEAPTSPTI